MKSINPKSKYYLSLAGLFLLLVLFWTFGIRKTLTVRQEFKELTKLDLNPKQVLLENVELKKQNERLSSGFDQNAKQSDSERLLSFLSSNLKKEKLELIQVDNAFSKSKESYNLFQLSFTVQGSYISILKLVREMENKRELGQIASINFERKTIGKRRAKLHARITTQRITRQ